MYRSILAATDSIDVCHPATVVSSRLAALLDADVHVIHVLEPPTSRYARDDGPGEGKPTASMDSAIEKTRQGVLKCSKRGAAGLSGDQVLISTGDPVQRIVEAARELDADLLVVGPHNLSRMEACAEEDDKMGGTLQRILKEEPCPALIANRIYPPEALGFKTVLVAVDFSESCKAAARHAGLLAAWAEAGLHAFHMLPIPPASAYSQDDYDRDVGRAKERLDAFVREFGDYSGAGLHVWGGARPDQEIAKCVEDVNADVVVMGTHTREEGGTWYVGSAVQKTACRSMCPVIVAV
ncbi:MAG: universal stress protein [Desulfatibacillaceae bacterium]